MHIILEKFRGPTENKKIIERGRNCDLTLIVQAILNCQTESQGSIFFQINVNHHFYK